MDDELSIEFGPHWFDVAHVHDHSPVPIPLRIYVHFDVLQDLGSEVVFWFVAQVHDHSPLDW